MKTTKKIYRYFRYQECDSFAEYLHEMSLNGWHFCGWKAGMVFEKGEPADIHYVVEVFEKGTELDLKPEDETMEYADYCEAAGWEFIDSQRKFCVFKRIKEEAVPIVTMEARFRNVKQAEWKKWFGESLVSILLAGLYGAQFWLDTFSRYIFDSVMLLTLALIWGNALWRIIEAVRILRFNRKIKRQMEEGKEPQYLGKVKRRYMILRYLAAIVITVIIVTVGIMHDQKIYALILPVVLVITLGSTYLLEKVRPSRRTYHAFTIIFGVVVFLFMFVMTMSILLDKPIYDEIDIQTVNRKEVPLLKEDYTTVSYPLVMLDNQTQKSIFGKRINCTLKYGDQEQVQDYLRYQICVSRHAWIMDKIWEMDSQWFDRELVDCAGQWDAIEAGRSPLNVYYIRYPQCMIILHADQILTEDQIRIIKEKLGF